MSSDALKAEWEALSTPWIRETRHGKNPTRTGLLDRPMIDACGDVTGKRVLDCGCGEGRFCRMMASRGARYVLGLDRCEPMIRSAQELPVDAIEYHVADVQNLGFLEDASFDVAVSYLNQCDLPDFASNTREVFRVLRPGGRFAIANLHPMRSAVGYWQKSAEGVKQHVILDRYLDEGARRWNLMGVDLTNFHRSLATYVNCFLETGFRLVRLIEPTVTCEEVAVYPELADEQRVPNFVIYVLDRPE